MKKPFPFLRLLRKRKPSSENGLTLIECLVAISVIAATSATIAPVIVLSVATRVQNQKAEQALQLAQGEIDRVRLLVERNSTYTSADLILAKDIMNAPLSAPTASPTSRGTAITMVPKPTSLAPKSAWSLASYSPDAFQAREIDTNGDNTPDFVIQSFRGGAVMVNTTMPVAFDMGVRVYDYAAITNAAGAIDPSINLETEAAGLGFTSGEGQRGRRPLAVLYTQIINSDNPQSLCEYLKYLQTSTPTTMKCD